MGCSNEFLMDFDKAAQNGPPVQEWSDTLSQVHVAPHRIQEQQLQPIWSAEPNGGVGTGIYSVFCLFLGWDSAVTPWLVGFGNHYSRGSMLHGHLQIAGV